MMKSMRVKLRKFREGVYLRYDLRYVAIATDGLKLEYKVNEVHGRGIELYAVEFNKLDCETCVFCKFTLIHGRE
jgi:hypothetical protein